MRGIFSLWTQPPSFRCERGPLLIATLAIALARETFRELVFVTDSHGAAIATALGWQFDSLSLALERLDLPGCEYVWAAGKLGALRLQDRPSVHVDGDVLLLGKYLPSDLLASPLIAQSPDVPSYYTGEEMERALEISGLPRGFAAYNGGLSGGADVALVQDCAAAGLERVRKFAGHGEEISGTVASMICEQYQMGVFAAKREVSVGTLLPMYPTPMEVALAAYAHLAGVHKRNPVYVARVEKRLSLEFPEALERALAGLPSVL